MLSFPPRSIYFCDVNFVQKKKKRKRYRESYDYVTPNRLVNRSNKKLIKTIDKTINKNHGKLLIIPDYGFYLAKKVGAQDVSHKSWITVKPILRMKLCKPIKHAVDERVLFSFEAIRGKRFDCWIRPIHP